VKEALRDRASSSSICGDRSSRKPVEDHSRRGVRTVEASSAGGVLCGDSALAGMASLELARRGAPPLTTTEPVAEMGGCARQLIASPPSLAHSTIRTHQRRNLEKCRERKEVLKQSEKGRASFNSSTNAGAWQPREHTRTFQTISYQLPNTLATNAVLQGVALLPVAILLEVAEGERSGGSSVAASH
jgi:hypothetical protein